MRTCIGNSSNTLVDGLNKVTIKFFSMTTDTNPSQDPTIKSPGNSFYDKKLSKKNIWTKRLISHHGIGSPLKFCSMAILTHFKKKKCLTREQNSVDGSRRIRFGSQHASPVEDI